jgi:aspartyl-tRNA(Asn)/glutamyl-tRNA(Gln) amidotransferase subunit C
MRLSSYRGRGAKASAPTMDHLSSLRYSPAVEETLCRSRGGMKITLDEVRRVAALAHLELDSALEERLRANLDQILGYVGKLDEIDTAAVEPALGVTEQRVTYREDRELPGLPAEEALANAPESNEGHFKVPRVIPG